jgi:ParB family chromosome partitioning protein
MQPQNETIQTLPITEIDEPPILLHPEPTLEDLEELANSIKNQGLIQPIVVRPKGNRYQLVAGYRRYLAAKKFGLTQLPARIIQMDEAQALEASATENIQRTDLDPVAEGKLYSQLINQHNRTVKEIADKLGKSEQYIKARIALLDMPEPIQQLAKTHQIQLGVIPLLKKIPNQEEQILLASDISKRGFTVEAAQHLIDSYIKYCQTMQNQPREQILEKAREEPLMECEWCHQTTKLNQIRQLLICDNCKRWLTYLDEKEKRISQTQTPTTSNPPQPTTPTTKT